MNRAARIVLILATTLAAGAAVAAQRRSVLAETTGQGGSGDAWLPVGGGFELGPPASSDPFDFWTLGNYTETQQKVQDNVTMIDPARNVRALLQAIAVAEGTAREADPYRVCYAYSHVIQSFNDHPYSLGEWKGVKLTDQQCRGAGLSPGCISTAAGKYQITVSTWRSVKPRLGLPDFSPASQDAAAIELLREVGALALIERGDLAGAVAAARRTWASLPGAGYAGQGERSFASVQSSYLNAGGLLA